MSIQIEKECFACDTEAETSLEVPHPILQKTAHVPICQEHLDMLPDGTGGECAFCGRMPDYEFPTEGDRAGQLHLCGEHGQPILARLE